MSFMQEFKEFAVKGNAVDMAVGIIMGAAFNKIVSSLVGDIIMPPLGKVLGGVDFKNLKVVIQAAAEGKEEVAIKWGMFINNCIDFVIVAFAMFVVVKMMNKIIGRREVPKPA